MIRSYTEYSANDRNDGSARLDGQSGPEALELFIAAYVTNSGRSYAILRAMSDEQIEEAFQSSARSMPRGLNRRGRD
jgi:hypothetical protein